MRKFINSFTTAGKILMFANLISLIAAFVLKRYAGLPFAFISVLCIFASFRKQQY